MSIIERRENPAITFLRHQLDDAITQQSHAEKAGDTDATVHAIGRVENIRQLIVWMTGTDPLAPAGARYELRREVVR